MTNKRLEQLYHLILLGLAVSAWMIYVSLSVNI